MGFKEGLKKAAKEMSGAAQRNSFGGMGIPGAGGLSQQMAQQQAQADNVEVNNITTNPNQVIGGQEPNIDAANENKIKGDNDYSLADIIAEVGDDKEKVKEWIANHPGYVSGEKTKAYLEGNDVEKDFKLGEDKSDSKVESKAKRNLYKNQKSIWDAYLDGDFGADENGNPTEEAKRTRNYLMLDAIATFAKNTGKSIRNIGASYAGGSTDNSPDAQSKWEQSRNDLLGNETQATAETEIGGPAWRQAHSEELGLAQKEIDTKYSEDVKQAQLESMLTANGLNKLNLENTEQRTKAGRALLEAADKATGTQKYWLLYWGDKLLSQGASGAVDSTVGSAGKAIGALL